MTKSKEDQRMGWLIYGDQDKKEVHLVSNVGSKLNLWKQVQHDIFDCKHGDDGGSSSNLLLNLTNRVILGISFFLPISFEKRER